MESKSKYEVEEDVHVASTSHGPVHQEEMKFSVDGFGGSTEDLFMQPNSREHSTKGLPAKKIPFLRPVRRFQKSLASMPSLAEIRLMLRSTKMPSHIRIFTTFALASVFFFMILLYKAPPMIDDSLHSSALIQESGTVGNGLHAVYGNHSALFPLNLGKSYEVMDLLFAAQRSVNTTVYIRLWGESTVSTTGPQLDARTLIKTATVVLTDSEEKELDVTWGDMTAHVKRNMQGKPVASLYFEVTADEDVPIGFMFMFRQMGHAAKFRPLVAGFILCTVYAVMITDVMNRMIVAIVGSFFGLIALAAFHGTVSINQAVAAMDFSTLGLLFGLMVLVQVLTTTGGLERLAYYACLISKGHPFYTLVLMSFSCFLISCVLPNIAAVLVVVPTAISICELMEVDPRPFVIVLSIFASFGGTATMIGDFPNLLIASNIKGVTFVDFLSFVMPGILWSMPFLYGLIWFLLRDTLKKTREMDFAYLEHKCRIRNKETLIKVLIAGFVIIVLMFLSPVHGKDVAWIAVIGAMLVLATNAHNNVNEVLDKLELDTLFYLGGLFVLMEVCVQLKLIRLIGQVLNMAIQSAPVAQQNLAAVSLLIWVSAAISSVLDNTAYTLCMVKVINVMVADGLTVPIKMMAWCLSFGANLGGNATMIGAAASVVACGVSSSRGYPISVIGFSKLSLPLMMTNMVTIYIYTLFAYIGAKHYQ